MIRRWPIAEIARTEGFYPPESLSGVRVRHMGPRAAAALWAPGGGEPALAIRLCGLSHGPLAALARLQVSVNGRPAPHRLSWPPQEGEGPARWEARVELTEAEGGEEGWLVGVRTARTRMETALGERRWTGVALSAVEVEHR